MAWVTLLHPLWDDARSETERRADSVGQKMNSLYLESEGDRGNIVHSVTGAKISVDAMQSLEWEGRKCRECANRQKRCEGGIIPLVWITIPYFGECQTRN